MPVHYPFAAVVGCDPDAPEGLDDLGLALLLSAVSPDIGGVLVRGQKGTAKSTAVRGLAALLPPIDVIAGDRFSSDPRDPSPLSPDGPFAPGAAVETRPVRLVELPVGATEDRVLGSLHLERALSDGRVEYEPGLLARAHRGILYVDEVNLLHDHLVDALLDAAATGRVSVERDNVSVEHAARFVLVGTMNPEEGELRPQLLDRFGLSVDVAAPREPALRAEVVRRRLAFDADPTAFAQAWAAREQALAARIGAAQRRLRAIELTDTVLLRIAELCAAFEVDGLRADIVTARTAAAHAAWSGRDRVTLADVRAAARLALPHRRRRNPLDAPGLDEDRLDDLLGEDPADDDGPDPGPDGPDGGGGPGDGAPSAPHDGAGRQDTAEPGDDPVAPADQPPDQPADQRADQPARQPAPASTVGAAAPYRARLFAVAGLGEGTAGRRSRALTPSGRRVGAARSGAGPLHLVETVRAAAPHQRARGRQGGALALRPADLRVAVREGREANLVLFCVDASGSMAARRRMAQVKTAVLSLLLDAYRRRDKVGLISFRGTGATVLLPPTRSVDVAASRLEDLPAGGRTPLAEGLAEAAALLEREALRDPGTRPLLVVVTDGRATAGDDPLGRAHAAAAVLAARGVHAIVLDCESGALRLGLGRRLADQLVAEHVPVGEVEADVLTRTVRERTA